VSGWQLILTLLVLGGVLATLGDRLGSRVGKARLSLFNLRPRRTAVLITALTGSLISAMSLGLMLLVSERLRMGLFELDQLQDRLSAGRTELAERKADLARAETERRQAERRFQDAQERATSLRRELEPLQRQRAELQSERDRLSAEVKTRDGEIQRTEAELAQLQGRIASGAKELKELEANLLALRRGDVVISSGEPLASAKVKLQRPAQAREVIDAVLQQANVNAFRRVLPGQPVDRQILLVPVEDINKLTSLLTRPGSWVLSILSAGNVLRGERQVLAFPDLRPNRPVLKAGEVLASTTIEGDLRNRDQINRRLNLLLVAAYARVQRKGSVADGLQVDPANMRSLSEALSERPAGEVAQLEALALRDADTPDPVIVQLRWSRSDSDRLQPRRP
jgi:uncharacterized protein (DUF3084 family)